MEALEHQLTPNDIVWVHDYHLLPLAGMIREKFPDITIGFFLHIPFPSYEIFRMMPNQWQDEILRGMLGADLIGFHTIDYVSYFLKCVQHILGIGNERQSLKYRNRLVKTDVFPISIDYQKFSTAYNLKEVAEKRRNYREQFEGMKIIFSVDRLDYTKGVMCRLKGYEEFLKLYPQYIGKVVFIMAVVPSRDNIPKYQVRKKEIDEFIGSFNARVGHITWKPVIYQYNHLEFEELCALYTGCDLALITPLRDGMNLVSKEFVASLQDCKGVLLLSEMTGASRELTDAILINPNDTETLAHKIKEGLEMPLEEQERRLKIMNTRIRNYDVNSWAEDFLQQLSKVKKVQKEFEFLFLNNSAKMMFLLYRIFPGLMIRFCLYSEN
jgi:trehalose 6-phosphate synthase/phosphatase